MASYLKDPAYQQGEQEVQDWGNLLKKFDLEPAKPLPEFEKEVEAKYGVTTDLPAKAPGRKVSGTPPPSIPWKGCWKESLILLVFLLLAAGLCVGLYFILRQRVQVASTLSTPP